MLLEHEILIAKLISTILRLRSGSPRIFPLNSCVLAQSITNLSSFQFFFSDAPSSSVALSVYFDSCLLYFLVFRHASFQIEMVR